MDEANLQIQSNDLVWYFEVKNAIVAKRNVKNSPNLDMHDFKWIRKSLSDVSKKKGRLRASYCKILIDWEVFENILLKSPLCEPTQIEEILIINILYLFFI